MCIKICIECVVNLKRSQTKCKQQTEIMKRSVEREKKHFLRTNNLEYIQMLNVKTHDHLRPCHL